MHSVEPHTTVTMEKPKLTIRAKAAEKIMAEANYQI
jgi:hypothetical protein